MSTNDLLDLFYLAIAFLYGHLLSYAVTEEYLTIKEAAELLKVHPDTIKRWIKSGKLPAHRFGTRVVRILKADLPTYLRKEAE